MGLYSTPNLNKQHPWQGVVAGASPAIAGTNVPHGELWSSVCDQGLTCCWGKENAKSKVQCLVTHLCPHLQPVTRVQCLLHWDAAQSQFITLFASTCHHLIKPIGFQN